MTRDYRLAMMRTPNYDPSMDLVIQAPNGILAGFLVCSIDPAENARTGRNIGWTDPIGVPPGFRRLGLGCWLLTAGLNTLKSRKMEVARLGTSSENSAMQRLALSTGFRMVEEKLWFRKTLEMPSRAEEE